MSRLENMLYVKAVKEKSVANAPAPGSLEDVSLAVGAADGGCTSAGKAQAPGKGIRKLYADVHRSSKNADGYRIAYTTDGVAFKHVDDFTDIPVNAGDKLLVDVLPLHHTDGVIELLRRGVEVYYLRRLTLIKKKREELKLPKTTRGDIKVLMSIEHKWFRRVTEDFLVMRRMIAAYRTLLRIHQQLTSKLKAVSDAERHTIKPAIKAVEEQMDEMAKKIAEEAGRRYPAYNRLVEKLGIDGNTSAMEALAEILILPEWMSWRRTKNYFGMWKRDRKTYHHRSKTTRQALERLTMAIKGYGIRGRDLKEVLKTIWLTRKTDPPA